MIGAYYGVVEDLDDLRDRYPAPGRGSSLEWLAMLAGRLGLNARSLDLAPDEIVHLQLPAVLHWNRNHWVVVVKTNRRGALLNDPALGQRWATWTEIGTRFSRYALELTPSMVFERNAPRHRMRLGRFFTNIAGFKRSVAELLLLAVILEIIALLTPYYLQLVVDQVLVTGDRDMLTIIAAATGALLMFQTMFSCVRSWMAVQFSLRTSRQLFSHVISHLLRLPFSYFSKRTMGDLTTRFDSLSTLAQAMTRTVTEILLELVVLLAVLGMLFLYSLGLAAMVMSGLMVMTAAKAYVFATSRRLVSERTHFVSRRQSSLIETLRAIHAVKMARAEHIRADAWMRETDRITRKDAGLERINVLGNLVLSTISGLLHVAVIYWAARMILDKELTAGMLLAFLAYEQSFISRGSSLVDKCIWLHTLKSHFARVSDVVFTAPEVQPETAVKLPNPASVVIEGGAFRHYGEDRYVFRDLSLSIDSGEMVGITGPSGIGKTTLLCVLAGILPMAEGSVKYAGLAFPAERSIELREHIAFVFQSDELFEGTVSQNICFFASPQEAEFARECARLACIEDEILSWTHGFDTRLGEQGSRLSGGQRQRILIARALYRRPAVLFLDEATSQLDVATEKRVLGNVRSLGITVVLSAHRPTAMSECHRLIQLGPAPVPHLAVERQQTA